MLKDSEVYEEEEEEEDEDDPLEETQLSPWYH